MAKSKRLVCFYCNKKSDLRYDGQMTQWPCALCEAVNYLDENGEIDDPPVATLEPAAPGLRFATSRSESLTAPISDSNPFCATCLKNQHLLTASLQQYHLETDPTHPQYRESERLYFKYRRTLEATYPQVCADCLPRVESRMDVAAKTAKSDFLRRLLDKTRARKVGTAKSFSLFDLILLFTTWLWYIGIAGQLLWNVTTLLAIFEIQQPDTPLSLYLGKAIQHAQPLITAATSEAWARYSFRCTLFSIWWNPKFKELNNGFMNHITGFADWYKLQLLHIVIRSLFFYTMGSGVFSSLASPATAGAHAVVPIFVLILAIKSKRALRVDMNPLWKSTPEKIRHVGPRSRSPSPQNMGGMGGMAGILDEIAATPSNDLSQPAPTSAYLLSRRKSQQHQTSYNRPMTPGGYQNSYNRPTAPSGLFPTRHSTSPFRDIPQTSSMSYMSMGEASYHPQNCGAEEMEWTPSVPQTQARAFKPTRSAQPKPYPFGETSSQPSPFYGRLPEAPITPAHRLRNPPNQARLRVSSQEVKENFFNNITRQSPDLKSADDSKREMNLAQQKFFAPPPPSEAGNVLADLLTSFSLSSPEANTPAVIEERSARTRHIFQAFSIMLGLFFWNNNASLEISKQVMLTVMIGSFAIGIRTLLDNTVFIPRGKPAGIIRCTLGSCVAGLELTGAGYNLMEILAGRGDLEHCTSLGTVLMGGMLVHELSLALFGR
ncbi:uncharacterized protein LY89DRAFT_221917 [Mollisia scopiformis]|uniref:Ima1 N-terminal domain-containing protein n=1 Tax=Mollisia scopiformis TaxID=149040 RepID=A0A194WVW2_MOLSC|nr:uncharacterized protein LY89DRAFT_221917 [Mollisia scopiformis]KUJ12100.1 hypothetical protein LY89DRAFT_221917 [Mollisia scopiformis]